MQLRTDLHCSRSTMVFIGPPSRNFELSKYKHPLNSAVGPKLSLSRFQSIDTNQLADHFVFFWNRANDNRSLTRWNWSRHISNNHYSRGVTWSSDLVNPDSGEETQNRGRRSSCNS